MERTQGSGNYEDIAEALEQAAVLVVGHLPGRQGLAFTTALALSMLDGEESVRLTTLASVIGVSQPSMSNLVKRLEQQGMATRASDPDDGRATLIAITETGRAFLAERQQARRVRLAELMATLSAEEESALTLSMYVALPILKRMLHNATQPHTPKEGGLSWSPREGVRQKKGDHDD